MTDEYHTMEYIGDILVVLLIFAGMAYGAQKIGMQSCTYGTSEEDEEKYD